MDCTYPAQVALADISGAVRQLLDGQPVRFEQSSLTITAERART